MGATVDLLTTSLPSLFKTLPSEKGSLSIFTSVCFADGSFLRSRVTLGRSFVKALETEG